MIKFKSLFTLFVLVGFINLKAQKSDINTLYSKISYDSLKGFDEEAARKSAISENFFGKEFVVRISRLKREYINNKYKMVERNINDKYPNTKNIVKTSATFGCNNENFELATSNIIAPSPVQGWTLQSGTNTNSCQSPVLTSNNLYTVYSAPITDNRVPGTISSFFGSNSGIGLTGNSFIRLNDDMAGAKAVNMNKSFIIDSSNALFRCAFLAVMEDGSHPCCDQPRLKIETTITNTITNTSTVLTCPSILVAFSGAACTLTNLIGTPSFSPCLNSPGWAYTDWTPAVFDFSQYMGDLVRIDITVMDCDAGGHVGYVYFDAQCNPVSTDNLNAQVFFNGSPIIDTNTVVFLTSCTNQAIFSYPSLSSPHWVGPFGWTSTQFTIDANAPGTYTFTALDMRNYSCQLNPTLIKKIYHVSFFAGIKISSSDSLICNGEPVILSSTGDSHFNWSTGDTTKTITLYPGVTTNYTVSSLDSNGCSGSAYFIEFVDECMGIGRINNNYFNVLLYPNPNQGEFVLEISNKVLNAELTIQTMLGDILHTQSLINGQNKVKFDHGLGGLYIYNIYENKKIIYQGKISIE